MLKKGKGRKQRDRADSPPVEDVSESPPSGANSDSQTNSRARLGEMLVQEGVVTAGQLEEAIKHQKDNGGFIGNALIALQYIDQNSLISFLVKQCKIPHISLLDYTVNEELFQLVPKEICNEYLCVPIDQLGKILTVAMVDPFDENALESVRSACPDLKIKPILCDYNHFDQVARKHLGEADSATENKSQDVSAKSFGLSESKPASNKAEKKTKESAKASNVETFPKEAVKSNRWSSGNEEVLTTSGVAPGEDDRVRSALLESPNGAGFSFDDFVAGPSNESTESLALSLVESPDIGLSPMFVCGGVGLGKTHVLHAIGNAFRAADPDLRVRGLTAGIIARGCERGSIQSLFESCSSADVLLLDDVHLFAERDDAQAAFVEIFDAVCSANRTLVMTGLPPDSTPRAVNAQLASRIGGAVLASLKPPAFDTRVEILRGLAEHSDADLDDGILDFIAKQITDDVRRLKGAFNTVLVHARVTGGVSAEDARGLIVQFDAGAVA